MHKKKLTVFLRNDDVRDKLDASLIGLTEVCTKQGVPISHAVEPGNVTREVVEWLISRKEQYPSLIEIIQHGYNHNLTNPSQKMEFGGTRSFQDQFDDMSRGKVLMDNYFGNLWTPVFSFPYGTYNQETLKVINKLGYQAISSKVSFSLKVRIKNLAGKLLGGDMLLGKKINYHPGMRKGYGFREISVSANLIKKYTGESTADHFTFEEIISQINHAQKHTEIIGILFHHRFHSAHLEMTETLIQTLKQDGAEFSTIANIIR